MRFTLLGPLAVHDAAGTAVPLPEGRPRAVLAELLLHANRPVPVEQLTEALWPQDPPRAAVPSLRNHVLRLRKALGPDIGGRVRTVATGYRLDVLPGESDTEDFLDGYERGRRALEAGDAAAARSALAAALDLWAGEPAFGVPHSAAALTRVRHLEEVRLLALQRRIEADLLLGRHRELVSELRVLTAEHPLREELHGQLMLALYRSGRQSEALAAYQALRATLVSELGVEPSAPVRELHARMLEADPGLLAEGPAAEKAAGPWDRSAVRTGPSQLPTDIRTFTGREREVELLLALGREAGESGGAATPVAAVNGMGGVGKSALAVHVAHRLRDLFPDGLLFLDLHGHTPGLDPLPPGEGLSRLLRALQVAPQAMPEGTDERAALFRDRLAGTRTLLLLDNARTAAQIRPLLPGTPGCFVLVTSRRRLTGLDDAHVVPLDILPEDEGLALLRRVAGPGRIAEGDPDAAALVALCGGIPLALRMVGARLLHRPALRLRTLVRELEEQNSRLGSLQDEDRDLGVVLDTSYAALPGPEQTLFRRLGQVPGPDFDGYAAAHLLDAELRPAARLLESLLGHSMVVEHVENRYRLHDLVRLHARGLVAAEQGAEPAEAARRLLGYYLQASRTADDLATQYARPSRPPAGPPRSPAPEIAGRDEALAWFRIERENLVAAFEQALASPEQAKQATALADALAVSLQEGPWPEAEVVQHKAAAAARAAGDTGAEATALWQAARVRFLVGDLSESIRLHEQALALFEQAGDALGCTVVLGDLGRIRFHLGEYREAVELQERVLAAFRGLGDRSGEAHVLAQLGYLRFRAGELHTARDLMQQALEIYLDLGLEAGVANSRSGLARFLRALGELDAAELQLRRAQDSFLASGAKLGTAMVHWGLGQVYLLRGELERAAHEQEQALGIFEDFGHLHGVANVHLELGRIARARGDLADAARLLEQALAETREVADPQTEVEVLTSLADLAFDTRGPDAALPGYQQAAAMARRLQLPVEEAAALAGAARCGGGTDGDEGPSSLG